MARKRAVLTPGLWRQFCELVAQGESIGKIAGTGLASEAALRKWLARAEEGKTSQERADYKAYLEARQQGDARRTLEMRGSTLYTPEKGDDLCRMVAAGVPLKDICATRGMPQWTTLYEWLTDPRLASFRESYDRAQEMRMWALTDELVELSDNAGPDTRRDSLKIETRKWLMSKLAPAVFGNKVAHTGPTGGALEVVTTVTFIDPEGKASGEA